LELICPNWALQFGKPDQIFSSSVRCWVCVCDHCVSLISLGYLGFCWAWDFVGNLYSIPLDRAAYLYSKLNIKCISSTWARTRWLLPFHLFLTLWGLPHLILFWHWLFEGCHLGYFKPYNQFSLFISKSLYILIQ
jgi:hypothetical protein